jgi:4a-hydroxytetrahydrobiopterin dehydratase
MNTQKKWSVIDNKLQKTFTFPSYQAGVDFVVNIASIAESMDHHPDITLLWGKVIVSICTHSKNMITELDYTFSERCNALIDSK